MKKKGSNSVSEGQPLRCQVLSVHKESGYFVAVPAENADDKHQETITCHLSNWQDDISPQPRQIINMFSVRKFDRGWRANSSAPIKLENGGANNEVPAR